jgi:branched-chain amino acid transport system permease protein
VFIRWLSVLLPLLLLSACADRNPARVDLCLAALAGLEPGEARLLVDAIGGSEASIHVDYRLEGSGLPIRLVCRFAGDAAALGQLDLEAVFFRGVELGPGRLTFLKSHWLTTDGPFLAKTRIVRPITGYFAVSTSTGPYVQAALSAIPIGSVYVLLALGFALIHGVTGRMNIAHGEFATVGAYAGYAGFMGFASLSAGSGLWMAVGLAWVAAASAGLMVMRSVFLPLARREGLMLLVASAGLIIIFEEAIRISHRARELWLPPVLADPISLSPPPYVVTITGMQIAIGLATALLAILVLLVLKRSRFGRAWRAVSDDGLAARLMGIDVEEVLTISGLVSAGLAGLAGLVILLGYGNANHSMGLMLSIKAMTAAVIGGMGSPLGAVLGGLTLVALETFWVVAFGSGYRDAAVFAILIGLLTLLPNGLFGRARR